MTTTAKSTKNGKPASAPFEAFTFPTPTFEVPAAFRDFAEKSVSQARDAYAKMKTATEDATGVVEDTFETAREGAPAALKRDQINSSCVAIACWALGLWVPKTRCNRQSAD